MPDLARFLRTVSHLQPSQVWHRARYRVRRAWWERSGARVDAAYARRAAALPPPRFDHPGLAAVARLWAERRDPAAAERAAREALEGRFTLLGRSLDLGRDVAWFRRDLDVGTRLWKTRLHEFHFALDLALAWRASGDDRFRARWLELVESWRAAATLHRPGADHDAWDPRAAATRGVHLAVSGALLGLRPDDAESAAVGPLLGVHWLYLREHLEWDLRANHLLRDAVGLAFADELQGAGPGALALLRAQVREQVLPDGCHYERTPLYHALVLQDLVDVRALLGDRAPDWLCDAVARMAGFLAYLLHGDGGLPLLGDTWHGELDPALLLREAGAARPPEAPEQHGGLVALRRGGAHAVLRAGPHGPDFQLGHAHADGLSFELSLGERRLVTDTGTQSYDDAEARRRVRSTAAHNTVQIDGAEQIEWWDAFRVGRRGRGRVVARGEGDLGAWLWARHDGYRFLPGRPLHERLWVVFDDALLVLDAVTGAGRHRLRSALHLHPDFGASGARAGALGATAIAAPAPLFERAGPPRQLRELAVEAEGALPWSGGWWIAWGARAGEPDPQLSREGDALLARARGGSHAFEVAWNLRADPAREGVRCCRLPASA